MSAPGSLGEFPRRHDLPPGCSGFGDCSCDVCFPPERVCSLFFAAPLSRWQRIKLRFTWAYIRQTRPLLPLTEWWINRG